MKTLEQKIKVVGTGRTVTSSFVKRNGKTCFYQRSDGPYEVFLVQVSPAEKVFGKDFPEREVYPGNEDFGKTAWCYTTFTRANKKFNRLVDGY